MTVHVFQDSLDESRAHAEAPWWADVYRRAFGEHTSRYVADDGWAQRGGIDRQLILASGKTLSVDEKVRSEDWPDILLERWSDRNRRVPGWVQKDLACDFIAYAFVPSATCYLLPFLTLRRAWLDHGRDWIARAEASSDGFKFVHAQNKGYVTESVAVPTQLLLGALTDALTVTWQPSLSEAA